MTVFFIRQMKNFKLTIFAWEKTGSVHSIIWYWTEGLKP